MAGNILDLGSLSVVAESRRGERTPIVEGVSFSIAPGKVVALIGESGSGKTTISLACMGYARPGCVIAGGEVVLDGTPVLGLAPKALQTLRGKDISYVAQSAAASFNGALTINRQVTEIPVIKGLMRRPAAEAKAIELYRQLDLPAPEAIGRRYPHQVSGGQLQRLMAAMAMICDPKLLILDEPTTALDVTTQIEVLQAFKKLIRDKRTSAIYVSHDLAVVAQIADDILVLKDGRMVEYGPADRIISAPAEDYTRQLIAAAHVMPDELPAPRSHLAPRGSANPALLEIAGVGAAYGARRDITVLRGVSLELREGETLGLIGESGSGKTTLGRVVSGLMPPVAGEVRLEGRPLAGSLDRRSREDLRHIQFVFQMADVSLNPHHRIGKTLGRPLQFYFGLSDVEAARRVGDLLALVELPAGFAGRFPRELSGGQRQRVNLARALAAEPKLIICDEITSALDTIVAESILALLRDLQARLGVAYIFISHDISTIAKVADHVAIMRDGEVVEYDTAQAILTPPYHEHTRLLLESVPHLRTDWLDELGLKRGAATAAAAAGIGVQ